MTPKSLLRHKLATSTLDELTTGGFQTVIPEIDAIQPEVVTHVILCGGKVYYDLLEKRRSLAVMMWQLCVLNSYIPSLKTN